MPRFAANLSLIFCEVPILEHFEGAARAGLRHHLDRIGSRGGVGCEYIPATTTAAGLTGRNTL